MLDYLNTKLWLFFFPGFPNVGKSSVINSLVGRKVVSVSRTPGHTKYFQTYYLTPTVKMCDCPGLVFPSCVNKQLQVLFCDWVYLPVHNLRCVKYHSWFYLSQVDVFQKTLVEKWISVMDEDSLKFV